LSQGVEVHGVVAGLSAGDGIGGEQADQHHGRAREGIQRKLHRAVFAAGRAPDGDEEVLGHDGDFVEDEEQEEIYGEEDSVDAADQREEEGEELVGAVVGFVADIP